MSESAPFDRRRLFKRAAVLTGGAMFVGAGELSLPALAGTPENKGAVRAAQAPRVYTRAEWNARAPRSTASILNRRPDGLIVHHTASSNSNDFSLAHAFSLSRSIQNHHMDNNGWADTGQQLTISRGGHVMEGRNRSLTAIGSVQHVVGAHVANHNSHLLGIENEGLYTSARPTDQLWNALVTTLAWLCDVYDLDPHAAILGHRDFNATACPGNTLYSMLPQLRNEVAGQLGLLARRQAQAPAPQNLPGPRSPFDHGPAVGPLDPAP
jgi:hypothetical protein